MTVSIDERLAAFDAAAATYDADFTDTRLGRWLRGRVWRRLAETFQPGQQVLELGCGTGEDAVWLAQRGVAVVATDVSPHMLEVASAKAQRAGVADCVQLAQLDITIPAAVRSVTPPRNASFDGALANFGVLNCLDDRRPVAAALAEQLVPGGRLVAVVMGPVCLWEIAWYMLHGDLTRATRRWRAGIETTVGNVAALRSGCGIRRQPGCGRSSSPGSGSASWSGSARCCRRLPWPPSSTSMQRSSSSSRNSTTVCHSQPGWPITTWPSSNVDEATALAPRAEVALPTLSAPPLP